MVKLAVAGVVRPVVELGVDVSSEVESVVVGIRFVKLGETGVKIPPEVDGVAMGKTTSTNLDVRKQTSQRISINSTPNSSVKQTYHLLPEHWRLEQF